MAWSDLSMRQLTWKNLTRFPYRTAFFSRDSAELLGHHGLSGSRLGPQRRTFWLMRSEYSTTPWK